MNIKLLIEKTIELETAINRATQQAPNLECARALERASDFLAHQVLEYLRTAQKNTRRPMHSSKPHIR